MSMQSIITTLTHQQQTVYLKWYQMVRVRECSDYEMVGVLIIILIVCTVNNRMDIVFLFTCTHAVVLPAAPLLSFALCFILAVHMAASVWYVCFCEAT